MKVLPLRRPSAVVPGSPENTAKEDNQEVSAQSVPLGQVSLFSFSNCFPLNPPIKPRKAQWVKNQPAVQETQVQFLGREYPLEKEMATHSSFLA